MSTPVIMPPSRLLSISDGDTPEIKTGVRLLGIDAPELENAGSLQKAWGLKAKAALEAIKADSLAIQGRRSQRQVFCGLPPAPLDRYGRWLAYMGPYVPKAERGDSPPQDTFNLRKLAGGWAAPYLFKENIPKKKDLTLATAAVQAARKEKKGRCVDEDELLLGYEFRSLVRLARGEGGFSYPLEDLRTLGKKPALKPENYWQIPVEDRVFG
jgi:endonuclease YncB( thermonuclease family)